MNNKQRRKLRVLRDKIENLKEYPRTDKHSEQTLFGIKLELENMVFDEEEKINTLPDNLCFSRLADQLMESLEKIENVRCEVESVGEAQSEGEYLSNIDKAVASFDSIFC